MTKLVSAEALAQTWGISPKTLHTWARQRKIPHIRLERRVLFDPAEVETWLQERKISALTSPAA